jgi:hypothetical protein
VPDLLPLRFRGAHVIPPGFLPSAEGMRRSHVAEIVLASELQSADVLGNPPLPDPLDLSAAEHAHSPVCSHTRSRRNEDRSLASGRADFGSFHEGHGSAAPMRGVNAPAPAISASASLNPLQLSAKPLTELLPSRG